MPVASSEFPAKSSKIANMSENSDCNCNSERELDTKDRNVVVGRGLESERETLRVAITVKVTTAHRPLPHTPIKTPTFNRRPESETWMDHTFSYSRNLRMN